MYESDATSVVGGALSRRNLMKLSVAAAVGAAVGLTPLRVLAAGDGDADAAAAASPWLEATIAELQAAMASGELTSVQLTQFYLDRIARLNPLLHAVIETNPDALQRARVLDAERAAGNVRGAIHGIPVLLKDNIDTDDEMETTAGSLALVGSTVPRDAKLVTKLRRQGAVILGKSNLSEWANFRGGSGDFPPISGWSARGGFTRDPYVLKTDPSGSSSGSAVAVAANLATVAVGTETDGSITSPSGFNNIVGLKPTLGLVSQNGVIPIGHSQDCPGPMGRTVADVAALLGAIQTPSAGHGLTPPDDLPNQYTQFLRTDALRGARIGVDPQFFDLEKNFSPPSDAPLFDLDAMLAAMRAGGATIVRGVDVGDFYNLSDPEFTVLLYEFKTQIAEYLAARGNTSMRTLADLIAFNKKHCATELKYFGQEVFEAAQTFGPLTDQAYLDAVRECRRLARRDGLDRAFAEHNLDVLVGPTWSFIGSPAAVAGYPNISIPAGFTGNGRPYGASIVALAWQEPKLLGIAYAVEQAMDLRRQPSFKGSVPPEPPHFPGCADDSASASTTAAPTVDSRSRRLL